ncbi:hypothetical protein SPM24T3_14396 [Serratia sp. M24T3]|nr:hypothetical protein SPM24T3_14396 [Serratia sp. M24T3]
MILDTRLALTFTAMPRDLTVVATINIEEMSSGHPVSDQKRRVNRFIRFFVGYKFRLKNLQADQASGTDRDRNGGS